MYTCPVCGWDRLLEPPQSASGDSYEICPCCGFEFGVTDDDRGFSYEAWREAWIARGMIFLWPAQKPAKWDPVAQLRNIGADA